jgi:hypothetical protein
MYVHSHVLSRGYSRLVALKRQLTSIVFSGLPCHLPRRCCPSFIRITGQSSLETRTRRVIYACCRRSKVERYSPSSAWSGTPTPAHRSTSRERGLYSVKVSVGNVPISLFRVRPSVTRAARDRHPGQSHRTGVDGSRVVSCRRPSSDTRSC